MVILKDHIEHKSGRMKTVCVTACLTALGVPVEKFHYTGTAKGHQREAILRRHGYSVRSRKSALGKAKTVGQARKKLAGFGDPEHTKYLVTVPGHCLLLDRVGNTIVDTDKRKRDKRKIVTIYAVY